MFRAISALALFISLAISLTAQSQFPDLLWENGGNTRPAHDIIPISKGRLLVGSYDGSIRVWDLATKTSTLTLITTRFQGGRSMAVTPDETIIITGDDDGWVRCWSVESGRLLFSLGRQTGFITDVACSPQGDWVAVGDSSGVVRRWNLNNRNIIDTLRLPTPIRSIAVNPDGGSMVVTTSLPFGKDGGSIPLPARIVDVPGLTIRATVDGLAPGSSGDSPIYQAAYSSATTIRMAASNAILTVNSATGAILNRRDVDYFIAGGPETIVVPDPTSVVVAGVIFAGLRRYTDGKSDADTLIEFGRQVSALAVDQAAQRLYVGTQVNDVQVWDLKTGTFLFDLEGMSGYMRRAAWSKDGSAFATSTSTSDRVRIFDNANGSALHVISNPPWGFSSPASMVMDNASQSLYFTPVADDGARRLRRYDLASKSMDTSFSRRAISVAVSSTTDRLIVINRDSSFAMISGNPQAVNSSAIDVCSPWTAVSTRDGRIVSSCADTTLRLLDGTTGAQVSSIQLTAPAVDILVPSSKPGDSDVLVLMQYGRTSAEAVDAVIIDAQTLQEKTVLPEIGIPFIDGFIGNRVGCSKSAKYFAVGKDDGTIAIIETSTGMAVKTLETGGSPIVFLTVHPESESMVVGTADGRIARVKDPWPFPTSSVNEEPLTREQLQNADDVRWYLLDGRLVGSGTSFAPQSSNQPYVVVARYGANVRSQLMFVGDNR